MDVWEYFGQKEREFAELSFVPEFGPENLFAEEAGSNGKRGRIFGNLRMMPEDGELDAFLSISETIIVKGNHIHREEYAYFLVIDGVEIGGWERDLSHHPPVHRHTHGHAERLAAKPIAFREVAKWAWGALSAHAEMMGVGGRDAVDEPD